ncbi:MAG TPA: elongation factor P, partial [Clostridiales bacterium]|nr:elongation factor P [Clostridiales bacterium]
ELYYFMDMETYEQIPLNHSQVEEAIMYVKENTFATIKFFKGDAFSVEAPNFVELKISQTDPGFKGDTATGGTKPATLETGALIHVPLFVNTGDVVRVDTRTGEYMERM